jgi:hypothetical protein
VQRGIVAMADRVQTLETRLPIAVTDPNVAADSNVAAADTYIDGDPFTEDPGVDNDEHFELPDPPPRPRRPFNRQGMRGNLNHHNQHYVHNGDPFTKVKFSIPPFNDSYDVESYLNWEMTVEQKFSSHLVLKSLVSLKILLLSGGMNWLPLSYNIYIGLVKNNNASKTLLINVIYVRNYNA